MDLQHNGINIETLYNFGQPRIGDENYALCASNYLSIQRVTYLKDPVPHLPFHFFGYKHSCYEAYQSSTLEVQYINIHTTKLDSTKYIIFALITLYTFLCEGG